MTGFPGFCEVTVYAQKRIKAEGARTVWDTAYFSDNAQGPGAGIKEHNAPC